MKKFIMITMIALAAAGMIGCGAEDDTKADLMWTNNDPSDTVNTIQWVNGGNVDQTWGGNYTPSTTTAALGIKELVGQGECFIGSSPASITLDTGLSTGVVAGSISSNSAVIQENAVATLVIQAVAKK